MRVVLDTNVLVSGLLWDGPPNQLLKWGRDGMLEVISCEAAMEKEHNRIPIVAPGEAVDVINAIRELQTL